MASTKETQPQNQSHKSDEAASSNKAGIKHGIDELINQDRVVIFSKSTCPYCDDAKKVFDKLGQSYSTVELTTHPKGSEVQSALKEMTGAGTVPRVFVDGKCIGGGSDTVQLFQSGTLEQILQERSEDAMINAHATSGSSNNNSSGNERGSGEKFY